MVVAANQHGSTNSAEDGLFDAFRLVGYLLVALHHDMDGANGHSTLTRVYWRLAERLGITDTVVFANIHRHRRFIVVPD